MGRLTGGSYVKWQSLQPQRPRSWCPVLASTSGVDPGASVLAAPPPGFTHPCAFLCEFLLLWVPLCHWPGLSEHMGQSLSSSTCQGWAPLLWWLSIICLLRGSPPKCWGCRNVSTCQSMPGWLRRHCQAQQGPWDQKALRAKGRWGQ